MVMESFDAYYSYTDTIIDPDMADYFIEIAYEDLSDVRECIDKCEYSNENMSYIISNGNKIFRCDAWENILNDTYIFKLKMIIIWKKYNRTDNVLWIFNK